MRHPFKILRSCHFSADNSRGVRKTSIGRRRRLSVGNRSKSRGKRVPSPSQRRICCDARPTGRRVKGKDWLSVLAQEAAALYFGSKGNRGKDRLSKLARPYGGKTQPS